MRDEIKEALWSLKAEIVEPCEECGGAGYFPSETPGTLNPCKCMRTFYYLSALVEARIPRDYWGLALGDLDAVDDKYKNFVEWYIERMGKAREQGLGILFLGKNGTGKTSMQCVIGKEAIVRGYRVRYFTAQQYIEATKKDGDKGLIEDYENADFLLLDEIDKVYIKAGSSYVPRTIEEFLRRRISAGSVVIGCTNLESRDLSDTFGSSTVSMMERHLKFTPVRGDDFSDKLQSAWMDKLEQDQDFENEHITEMARRMWDREEEEYLRVWNQSND